MTRLPSGTLALVLGTALVSSASPAQEMTPPGVGLSPSSIPASAARHADIDSAIRTRNWDRAARLLADEIDRQPQARELLVLIARIFVLDSKPLNAAVALKKADAIAPLDDELRFTLVLTYVRLGRPDWARVELETLVRSRPDRADYPYWIGRLDYDTGKYASAISHFNEALRIDPQFMRAHDNLGLCYEALDEGDRAIVHYREANRLNRQAQSKSPWPATNLGILLRQRGELEEAGSLFREAIQYDRNFAKAHFQLGMLLEQQGQMRDAIAELERAAAMDPTTPEPHYVLSHIYRRQGETARADEALATFLHLREAGGRSQR
jgi:tetratricopeptide (TPR) repeat protein